MAIRTFSLVIKGTIGQARTTARQYRINLLVKRYNKDAGQVVAECRIKDDSRLMSWFCIDLDRRRPFKPGSLLLYTPIDSKPVPRRPIRTKMADADQAGWHHDR